MTKNQQQSFLERAAGAGRAAGVARERRPERGVTLIELLLIVAVVGILASVAYPSYQQYVIRGERAAAQKLMVAVANRETQYVLDARAYTDTIGAGGLNIASQDGWTCAATCANPRYTLTVALDAGPPIGFTITGTPTGVQTSDGVLSLTSAGTRVRDVGGVAKPW